MEPFEGGELRWPSTGIDPETPGNGSWRPERLLIGPIAPATDGLSQRRGGNDRVAPPQKRLARSAAQNGEGEGARDERAMEREAAEANVDGLYRLRDEVAGAQRDIIRSSSNNRKQHHPGSCINHPIGIQADPTGKPTSQKYSRDHSHEHEQGVPAHVQTKKRKGDRIGRGWHQQVRRVGRGTVSTVVTARSSLPSKKRIELRAVR